MSTLRSIEKRRWSTVPAVLLLAAAGIGLYLQTLPAPFIYDDAVAIVDNPSIRQVGPAALAAPRNTPTAGRPVVNASLAVNHALGGLDVRGYHAFNIAVHVCCAIVLFGIVRQTLERGGTVEGAQRPRPWGRPNTRRDRTDATTGDVAIAGSTVPPHVLVALGAAMLWLVHPLQVECVAYVTQRSESLMALFFLLTLHAAIRGWTGVAIIACALGMATKESMVTAPLLVVLYDWAYRDEPWRRVLARRRGLYAGLASTWIILIALVATGPRAGSVGFGHGVTAWQYALNQCVVVVGYVGRVFRPEGLLLDYGLPRMLNPADAAPYVAILAGLLAVTGLLLAARPRLGYPAAWFFVVLAPTSSVLPIATEVAADRRVYLALAGLAALAVAGGWTLVAAAARRPEGRRARWPRLAGFAALSLAVAALSTLTWRRAAMYREPVTLWEQAVEANPRNHRALTNLAVALAAEGRYADAIRPMRRALALNPGSTITGDNLAALLAAGATADR